MVVMPKSNMTHDGSKTFYLLPNFGAPIPLLIQLQLVWMLELRGGCCSPGSSLTSPKGTECANTLTTAMILMEKELIKLESLDVGKQLNPRSRSNTRFPQHTRAAKILFVNRSYWPDMEATGQLLTELCESLTDQDQCEVSVLCGRPNFAAKGTSYKKRGSQLRNNVNIRRTSHTMFDKSNFFGRAINFVSFCISAFFSTLFGPRPDVIVCQTDPPLSAIATCLVAFIRRTKFVCYLQDIYPDIAVECGKLREGLAVKALRKLLVWCYCRADKIVVVSNDMRVWLCDHGVDQSKVAVIQNWVDVETVRPIKKDNPFRSDHLLDGKFVVMYSGNVGQTQRFEVILDAADRLKHDERVVFMIVGAGVKLNAVKTEAEGRKLDNVRFLGYQPKDRLAESLSAADMQLVMLDQRMTQLMMPSKLYSALASGTPVLGIGDCQSHLAEIVIDNGCGWFFNETQLDELVEQIERGVQDPRLIKTVGKSARKLARQQFNRAASISQFMEMLGFCLPTNSPSSEAGSDNEGWTKDNNTHAELEEDSAVRVGVS